MKTEADSVVISLHSDIDGFEAFLKEAKAYEGNMFHTLLTVLSEKVFSDESNLISYQNDIVGLLASTEIINLIENVSFNYIECLTVGR